MVRILLVDDFEPFRSLVAELLDGTAALSIVDEAADGLAAVEKAQRLTPDLVLLDIGLPDLNGIEVARRIRKSVPSAKIVFLTLETEVEMVREAISLGACGYIFKQRLGSDLIAGLATILQGKQFISDGNAQRRGDFFIRN